jgi:hypothetical protein
MRCLVIALVFHLAILFALAAVKIVVYVRNDISGIMPDIFPIGPDPDPSTPTGDGGGIGGNGLGGVPNPGSGTPGDFKPSIQSVSARAGGNNIVDVIGVNVGDAIGPVRPEGAPGSVNTPSPGIVDVKGGPPGVKGSGDPWKQRWEPKFPQSGKGNGNTLPADRAVLAALRWLQTHQKADGSWESSRPAAIAGLATLAFLGHGHTPDDKDFGDTVNKSLQFLIRSIDQQDFVGPTMYDHAIVTYALAEGFGMTQSPALKEPLQRCINTILKAQQAPKTKTIHTGGWRYNITSTDADTSASGWCIQALEAAKLAGIEIPGSVFDDASKYLWAMSDLNGVFGYENPGGHVGAMTAVGVLSQAFMGKGGDHRIKKSLDKLKTLTFDWDKEKQGNFVVYHFYYLTQAMFQGGGSYWEYWNGQFRDALIQRQTEDGHWPLPPKSNEKYGDAYQTALCCLMLEVYYRYLPSYKAIERGQYERGIGGMGIPLPKMPDLNKK